MQRIKKAAAAIYGWDCPLLTFTYPGFDFDSLGSSEGKAPAEGWSRSGQPKVAPSDFAGRVLELPYRWTRKDIKDFGLNHCVHWYQEQTKRD